MEEDHQNIDSRQMAPTLTPDLFIDMIWSFYCLILTDSTICGGLQSSAAAEGPSVPKGDFARRQKDEQTDEQRV